MMLKRFFFSLLIGGFLLGSAHLYAASPSSCTNCHTNELIIKSLYKPPVLPPSEGEG
jgi:hypothetical protein